MRFRGTHRRKSVSIAAIALAGLLPALGPAAAEAGTISNGSFTASPGEANFVELSFDPAGAAFLFRDSNPIADGDGPGGCTVGPGSNQASCPQAAVGSLNISLLDNGGAPLERADVLSSVAVPVSVSGGDGNDRIEGGSGNDTLSGDAGEDQIFGNAGNDVEHGGGERDLLDGNGRSVDGVNAWSEGADTLDGGPGSDSLWGGSEDVAAPDTLACGVDHDTSFVGAEDTLVADCEIVRQQYTCPSGGGSCEILVKLEAPPGETGGGASAARTRKGPVVFGQTKARVPPGRTRGYLVKVKHGGVRKVLRGRSSAPARQVVTARKNAHKLPTRRLRFTLRR